MPIEGYEHGLGRSGDHLQFAGFWPRFCSLFLDDLIALPVASMAFLPTSHVLLTLGLVLVFFFELFYEVYLVRRWGGTPGKLIMGLRF